MELEVIKKCGTHEGWDWDKIEVAIHKAAQRANATYSEYDIGKIRGYIESIVYSNYAEVPTEKLFVSTHRRSENLTRSLETIRTPTLRLSKLLRMRQTLSFFWETRKTPTSIVPLCLPKVHLSRAI